MHPRQASLLTHAKAVTKQTAGEISKTASDAPSRPTPQDDSWKAAAGGREGASRNSAAERAMSDGKKAILKATQILDRAITESDQAAKDYVAAKSHLDTAMSELGKAQYKLRH